MPIDRLLHSLHGWTGPGKGRRFYIVSAACLVSLALAGPLIADEPPELSTNPDAVAVRSAVDRVLRPLNGKATVGLLVRSLDDGETWVSIGEKTPLKPASVLKLFTTAVALDRFGPDFEFSTTLYVHDGELLVLGGGDPGLGDERIADRHNRPLFGEFDAWAAALRAAGVTSLRTIAIDDRIFDTQYRHPDWPVDQAAAWYQAPVGGLNFNDNCLDSRAEVVADRLELRLIPAMPPMFVDNTLALGSRTKAGVTRDLDSDVFEFRGTVAGNATFAPCSVGHPTVFFGHALRAALIERGIDVADHIVRRYLPPERLAGARLIAEHSTSIRDVIWRANTFSQNMFAEALAKSLAAYAPDGSRTGVSGSWDAGRQVLLAALPRLGVDPSGAIFRDGSGLSHDNRVTAEQIVDLLTTMTHHRHASAYIESLAEAGNDGSMRHRYDDPDLIGRLRGKTGTIYRARAFAGALQRKNDGKTLILALLINGDADAAVPAQICKALLLSD